MKIRTDYRSTRIKDRLFIDWMDLINSLRILAAANPGYKELITFIENMTKNYDKRDEEKT